MPRRRDAAALGAAVERILALSKKEANRLGVTLFKAQQLEQAVLVFNKVLAQHPQSMTTWNNLAVAYEAWGKTAEARGAFEKGLSYDPVNEQTRKSYDAFLQKHAGEKAPEETTPAEPEPADSAGGEPAVDSP